jgi:mannosyl-oligosaccharide alpha-1,2-mannosidase
LSGTPKNPFGGWAATLVDSLDSLWLLGLQDEFKEAVRAVGRIDWAVSSSRTINLFETTIRHLGGLLGAHDLSGEPVLLAKAAELGDMLLAAFDTPNRIPPFWFHINSAFNGGLVAGDAAPTAGIGSMFMEFTRLSQFTNDPKYYDATDRVKEFFVRTQNRTNLPGMWPMTMNFLREKSDSTLFTLGANSDSLYEYLPKMYILLGGLDESYKNMALTALETAQRHLFFRPMTKSDDVDILFAGRGYAGRRPVVVPGEEGPEWDPETTLSPSGEHLTCFAGGMYMLAGKTFGRDDFVEDGLRLARGCAWAYSVFRTGIMPESFELEPCPQRIRGPSTSMDHMIFTSKFVTKQSSSLGDYKMRLQRCQWEQSVWDTTGGSIVDYPDGGFRYVRDSRYLLRPEAIESVFYAYRVTGDEGYRETAWKMFEAIEKVTRTELGNAGVVNVNTKEQEQVQLLDSMEVSPPDPYFPTCLIALSSSLSLPWF